MQSFAKISGIANFALAKLKPIPYCLGMLATPTAAPAVMHVVAVRLPAAPFITGESTLKAVVTEREFGKTHVLSAGAPDEWALHRGATHTLHLEEPRAGFFGSTRPVIVANRSTIYVGTDETPDGRIAWEKWSVRIAPEAFSTLMEW